MPTLSNTKIDTISERIRYAMDYRKLNQAWLAKYSGLSEGRISQILNEDGSPAVPALFRIADALNFEPRWLATGEGTMTKQKTRKKT